MRRKADWYLKEYKEQWDKYLKDRPERWQVVSTPGGDSLGVYETFLSPHVALRIGTSLNCGDKVCDYGQASIKTYLFAAGGACANIVPSKSNDYRKGILSNTKHSTGYKWRKRIDTWKRNVDKAINAAIKEYRSEAANFDLLAQNANLACSGKPANITNSRELQRIRATYFALSTILKRQGENNNNFGVPWLKSGIAQAQQIAQRLKTSGIVDPGAKKWILGVYKHKAFGRELLQLANGWLRRNTKDKAFKGKLANRQAVRKVLRRLRK